jgi:AraC-like DNA-binding protein
MQRLVLSTDDVPEAERFAYWREAVIEGVFGFSGERSEVQETPFDGRIAASMSPSVTRVRYRADGMPVLRRPGDIVRLSWEGQFWLHRELSAGTGFKVDGREFVTRPGDLVIGDTTAPFAVEALARYDHEVWLLPRNLLDPHLPVSLRPRSLTLTGSSGVAGMVKAYLDSFAAQIDTLGDGEAALVADNFCRLLAMACGAAAGDHKKPIRVARLEEAKRYIDLHLADPELTPEKAAGALRISLRQLHRLFEPSGTSFAQHVTRRRLEECRAAVLNPTGGRPVTDIALAWGFNSLSTFNRTFRRAFGAAPGELRANAAASLPEGLDHRALRRPLALPEPRFGAR